jgi:signal transduction histidine kinase
MSVGAVVSIVVIRRSLQPLGELAARISAVGQDELSARLSAATLPEEIVPVVQRLNELLQRLEEAFARERSLTADIAHELRTPVAGILTTVGVTLSAERTAAEYQEAFQDVRGIARQMRSMIENLLTLARLDAGQAPLPQEPIELCAMVARAWRSCEPTATARGLTFHNDVPQDFRCSVERTALVIVLSNLLENAVQYTDEGGQIWVTARCSDGVTELAVANSGCTLTGEQVNRVFDRFWRSDASRKETSLHVGLGLSLAQRIAQSWEGTATATVDRAGIFRIHVAWPSHRNRGGT